MTALNLRMAFRLSPEVNDDFDWLQNYLDVEDHSEVLRRVACSFPDLIKKKDSPVLERALRTEAGTPAHKGASERANFRVHQAAKDGINVSREFFGAKTEKEGLTRALRLFRTLLEDESLKPMPEAMPNVIRISDSELAWLLI